MGSDSPTSPRASAIPSHMLNGSSPLHPTGSRHSRERESLNTSIRSSFEPRIPLEFESPQTKTETKTETEAEAGTETGAAPAQSVSSASVPIRSVAPVRYVYSDITINDNGAFDSVANLCLVLPWMTLPAIPGMRPPHWHL